MISSVLLSVALLANAVNLLPPRGISLPCENEDLSIDILQGFEEKAKSRWIISLNGWETKGNPATHYATTFKRPWRWWFRRTTLHCDGIAPAFSVRVNGEDVGFTENGLLPAEFDLTPHLKIFGTNKLEIKVCDPTGASADPAANRPMGLFRDVYLISERKSAPYDLIVETKLSDDLKSGSFIVRDEKGNVLKERDVPDVRLWSPELPNLYITPLEYKWGWWIFGGTDYRSVAFGFRKTEIRGGKLYLNGTLFPVKGVNRVGISAKTGYALTQPELNRDASLLKAYNINAIRPKLCPDDPFWLYLCDRDGIFVCCEARDAREAALLRGHPSVLGWSAPFEKDFIGESGLFELSRNPRPVAAEVKHAFRTISCESFDFATGKVRIRNGFLFKSLKEYSCLWHAKTAGGAEAARGEFEMSELAPGATAEYTLEKFTGDKVVLEIYGDDGCEAREEFANPSAAKETTK